MKRNLSKKRLLVLSSPIGSGHIKAAEALCQTYKKNFKGEAIHVNFLDYLNPRFGKLVEQGYFLMIKFIPYLNKIVYDTFNKPNKQLKRVGEFLDVKKYRKLIEQYKPDMILSTHYIPAMVVSWMYKKFPIPNGVIITDFDFNSMCAYPNNDRVFIGCREIISDLEKMGIERKKICVSGIPIRPNFLKSFENDKLKKKLGLDLRKPVLLMMNGGTAAGPLMEILKSLAKVRKKFQILVITGHNEKMAQELKTGFGLLKLEGKILGFVDNIEEYMAVSDLLISKAGGLTTTESLIIGLPMLIIKPTPGQEDGNTEFLTKAGAAIYIKNIKKINLAVDDLLKNPNKIEKMRVKAKKLSRPEANKTILGEMLKIS